MKKPTNRAKAKEYAARPFAALKGLKPALTEAAAPPPPLPTPPVEEDGDLLFLQAMAAVRPLPTPRTAPGSRKSPAAAPQRPAPLTTAEQQEFLAALRQLRLDVSFRDSVPGDAEPKRPKTVDRLRQLQRGIIRLDYELDLHGLTRDEALASLAEFIASAVRRQQKAVLVIVGQGHNSSGAPVLQGAVASWLRDHGRDLVAEFAPAPRDMGGDGAFVVFLRKPGTRER
jgi:DNA-nicking Smr family endonuclease